MGQQDKTAMETMKTSKIKLMGLLLCFVAFTMLVGCTKEESNTEGNNPSNPLIGTKWKNQHNNSKIFVLEFNTDNQCQLYVAYNNMTYYTGRCQGSYHFSNNSITFSNLKMEWKEQGDPSWFRVIESGLLENGAITTTGYAWSEDNPEQTYSWNRLWEKI